MANKHIPNPTVPDGHLVREAAASPPGMAHFTGTGPPGTSCIDCGHFVVGDKMIQTGSCRQYMQMTRRPGLRFNGRIASCRYYKEKK